LYIKKGVELKSHIIGGGQERNLRAGTENISGIAGLGLAAELSANHQREREQHLSMLATQFHKILMEVYPEAVFNSSMDFGLPGVVNVTLPNVTSDIMLIHLDMKGFAVSSGSACASGIVKPSPVLKAMGVSNAMNIRTLRISFGRDNTPEEMDELTHAIADILKKHGR